ncbi:hypothetical protein KDL01_29270 [Actinospica durhamensis]|uniref:Uncharacterized protein n=1 Tax=Actinospica durhamensis TaxID=1508375 RepID=A0A941EU92_9ACTN|nr:hypothetical protein [Actinospica durhamensis]MBR7837406.1 hypothetical protein [Actinospica durhamensis]
MSEDAMHHLVVLYDIQASAALADPEKLIARQSMNDCCDAALAAASIPSEQVTVKDLGDGAMLRFTADVPKSRVLGVWLREFHAGLKRDYEQMARPSQIRLAVHAGELHRSLSEHTGATLDFIARLVNAPVAKQVLEATPSAPLAVVVSEQIYDQVVRHRGGELEPDAFTPISVQVKETDASAWLYLPGWARVPMPPGLTGAEEAALAARQAESMDNGTARLGRQEIAVSGGNVGVIGQTTVHGSFNVGGPAGLR